ncbi:MAG: hypothetical protein M4579_006056 [Chaenotheca gracillima]|nr:MAG: hypothetical protein M4579_006056 [Chaenotheca gracillima]
MSVSSQSQQKQPDVGEVLQTIATEGDAYLQKDEKSRKRLLEAAQSLTLALETPSEAVNRICWAAPTQLSVARVAVDLKIFEKLSEDGGTPKTTAQLATATGADPALIGRVLKHLASVRLIAEIAADTYGPNHLTKVFCEPKYRDGISFCFDLAGPPFQRLPEYLAKNGYKDPTDVADGPFQYGHRTELNSWGFMKANPQIRSSFNNHMSGYAFGRPHWMDPGFYPVEENLIQGFKDSKDAVMIVDVGGGLGHDLELFYEGYPKAPGRLINQDIPDTIGSIAKSKYDIEHEVHDFYTPQPIKGARAYYLHSVLHDWGDENALKILQQLVPALEKGYSKILINENVIPDTGASWEMTSLDFYMMGLAASRERTESQWRKLLDSAGLKAVKIWFHERASESLIEAELE